MGFDFRPPAMNMPEFKPVLPSEAFVETVGEEVKNLRVSLKQDEDFVGEYFTGAETIIVTHIGVAGRDSVRLIGIDSHEQRCYTLAHIATVSLLFRIVKKATEHQKKHIGFTVDLPTK